MFRHVIKGRNLGVQTKRGKSNVYIKNGIYDDTCCTNEVWQIKCVYKNGIYNDTRRSPYR